MALKKLLTLLKIGKKVLFITFTHSLWFEEEFILGPVLHLLDSILPVVEEIQVPPCLLLTLTVVEEI